MSNLHHLFMMSYGEVAPDASVTFTASAVKNASTPYTFASHALGTAATGRRIIIAVAGSPSNTMIPSGVTVGGSAAALVTGTDIAAISAGISIWIIQVNTGTTADIVVTFPTTTARCGIGVWAAYDLQSTTRTAADSTTGSTPLSRSIDVSAGGIVIGAAVSNSSLRTHTWTNLTENYDQAVGGGGGTTQHSGACEAFAAAQTGLNITDTLSGSAASFALAVAAFR